MLVSLSASLVGLGCLVSGTALSMAPVPPVPADSHPPGAPVSPPMSLDRAIALVEQQQKARVVRATEELVEGRMVYVLRLLSDEGRVWTVRIDAQSGVMN
jgi:uncharacterized membrane protein YkoI